MSIDYDEVNTVRKLIEQDMNKVIQGVLEKYKEKLNGYSVSYVALEFTEDSHLGNSPSFRFTRSNVELSKIEYDFITGHKVATIVNNRGVCTEITY